MKKRKWLIPVIIGIIVLLIGIMTYQILNDKNKLTSEERKWINSNINNIQNVYVAKDEYLFSRDGHGVFNNFLDDFSKEYDLKINIITVDNNEDNGIFLKKVDKIQDNYNIFYKDHYILVSKNKDNINSAKDLDNKKIGVLSKDLEYIKNYLKNDNIYFINFDESNDLINALGDSVDYLLVQRIEFINQILISNLEIVYHFNDINMFYVLNNDNSVFGNVINKYYLKWNGNVNKYLKEAEFQLFTKALNISEYEIDNLLSVDYDYGFINNSPYEVIMNAKYGGIIAEYLKEFSDFSGVYFDITKYKNDNKLLNAITKGKVDLYFSFNENFQTDYTKIDNGIKSSISILSRIDSDKIIDSTYGLQNEEVYVEKNSILQKYLESIGNIKINTYNNNKELFHLNKKDVIIVMDSYIYDYYRNSKLNNYINRYDSLIDDSYSFKIDSKYSILIKLLNKYFNYLDESTMISKGINSHIKTIQNGNIINSIAKYFILSIITILIVGMLIYRNSKKIRIARKIRKDDKIRFIDDLTCLKNRAYLSDSIKSWNNNAIYPQAIIVVDLNKLQTINDKYGVAEGDRQIRSLANALIKTQLDNSDLMRSDGNEFVIYTVGYNQKQIVNYIHKLNKEIKRLPYDYGAEFGYSIIENNLKTIEDALNEATIEMKSKKASGK